jgi:predicted ATP-dependent endonuclease of OLD family
MKIHFSGIGCIKKFDFKLMHGLTLFCGQNNTGKTYAAYALYSILTHFREISASWMLEQDIESLLKAGSISIDLNKSRDSTEFLDGISRALRANLPSDFDAPRDFFGNDCIRLSELHENLIVKASIERELNMGPFKMMLSLKENIVNINASVTDADFGDVNIIQSLLLRVLNQVVSDMYTDAYLGRAYVLTAERSAINLFSRELSSSRNDLVDQLLELSNSDKKVKKKIDFKNILGEKAMRYSLPIRDGLKIAEDLKNISKNEGKLAALATKLEEVILGGKIQIGEHGELIYSKNESVQIRIHLTASMVKSLASLVIYLRYQSKVGDLLIIDEPELNLHPDNQRRIARFLCEVVNAGVDVIISTHSDYIIREINNTIILNAPRFSEVKQRHGYQDSELISSEKVSVVLFGKDGLPKQITVGETGFAVESIDEEINLLNQISEEIAMELE